jgi:hypothetical protein
MHLTSSPRVRTTIGAVLLAGCLLQAAQASADRGQIRVALPDRVSVPGPERAAAVHGQAWLRLPTGWRGRAGDGSDVAHLTVPLSPSCTGEVEVQVAVSHTTQSISAEVRQYVDFWFDTGVPAPVKPVAAQTDPDHRWLLAVPYSSSPSLPSEPARRYVSPFFGVFIERLAPHVWASIGLGPRLPAAVCSGTGIDTELQPGLELMLRSVRIAAKVS